MKHDDVSFDAIANEIINNKHYKELKKESHHGLSRYEHSLRVAKNIYIITKIMKLDYVSATRAALLHDFFFNEDFKEIKGLKKGMSHPQIALTNAKKHFVLNKKEEQAILTHMFPLTITAPKSIEGLVLVLSDKSIATYEYSKFKFNDALCVYVLFVFNVLIAGGK